MCLGLGAAGAPAVGGRREQGPARGRLHTERAGWGKACLPGAWELQQARTQPRLPCEQTWQGQSQKQHGHPDGNPPAVGRTPQNPAAPH